MNGLEKLEERVILTCRAPLDREAISIDSLFSAAFRTGIPPLSDRESRLAKLSDTVSLPSSFPVPHVMKGFANHVPPFRSPGGEHQGVGGVRNALHRWSS